MLALPYELIEMNALSSYVMFTLVRADVDPAGAVHERSAVDREPASQPAAARCRCCSGC